MPWPQRLRLELHSTARCHLTLHHCAGHHPWIPWLSWHHFRDLCRGFLHHLYPREHLFLRVLAHLFLHRHFQFQAVCLASRPSEAWPWPSLRLESHHPSVSHCLSLSWASRLPSASPCSWISPKSFSFGTMPFAFLESWPTSCCFDARPEAGDGPLLVLVLLRHWSNLALPMARARPNFAGPARPALRVECYISFCFSTSCS